MSLFPFSKLISFIGRVTLVLLVSIATETFFVVAQCLCGVRATVVACVSSGVARPCSTVSSFLPNDLTTHCGCVSGRQVRSGLPPSHAAIVVGLGRATNQIIHTFKSAGRTNIPSHTILFLFFFFFPHHHHHHLFVLFVPRCRGGCQQPVRGCVLPHLHRASVARLWTVLAMLCRSRGAAAVSYRLISSRLVSHSFFSSLRSNADIFRTPVMLDHNNLQEHHVFVNRLHDRSNPNIIGVTLYLDRIDLCPINSPILFFFSSSPSLSVCLSVCLSVFLSLSFSLSFPPSFSPFFSFI